MNRTKIEWVRNPDGSQGYTANPVKGYCPMACPYCYARRLYDRFGWDKTIREDMAGWYKGVDIREVKQPAKIFVGSTIELFHDSIPELYIRGIFSRAWYYKQHTFIFLTKQPQNLQKWSPFPENCWVGASASKEEWVYSSLDWLNRIDAPVKFLSLEPLHERMALFPGQWAFVDWLIIGAETGNRKEKPPLNEVHKWTKEIIEVADEAGIPVFLKDNLQLAHYGGIIRREFPKGVADATKRIQVIGGNQKKNKQDAKGAGRASSNARS